MGHDLTCLSRQKTNPEIRQLSRDLCQRKIHITEFKKINPIIIEDDGPADEQLFRESFTKTSSMKNQNKQNKLPHNNAFAEDYYEDSHGADGIVINKVQVKWNEFIKMKKKKFSDDYYIITQIGKGGFGSVYKVMMKNGNLLRAAKKIQKSKLKEEEHESLLNEMAIMMSLDHPNIAKLYEVYDQKTYYVMVMELCEGGELFEWIVNEKVGEPEGIVITKQILSALNYMHTQGIVHRDIKPENMLFDKKTMFLKLIDFGISTKLPQKPLSQRVGTPYYIAPEVLMKRYNQKCDLWSTGVVIFMMIAGKPPFKGKNPQEVMEKIVMEQPVFSKKRWEDKSGQCIDFVQQLLKKKPKQRLSAKKALQHPWIVNSTPSKNVSVESKGALLQRMKKFRFKNKLEAVVHTFIASQLLSNGMKNEILEYFNDFDKNNNGVIEIEQLREALSKNPRLFKENDDRIQKILDYIDTNCSGKIDYTQFVVVATNFQENIKKQHFQQAFSYFDIDRSGQITFEEICQFLDEESTSAIKQMFMMVDDNGDGLISKEEFVKLLMARDF